MPATHPPSEESPYTAPLTRLSRATTRLSRTFALVNAGGLVLVVALGMTGSALMGTPVLGRVNLGILLGLLQGAVLLWTAARYDHRLSRSCDPAAERIAERLRFERRPVETPADPFGDLWMQQRRGSGTGPAGPAGYPGTVNR